MSAVENNKHDKPSTRFSWLRPKQLDSASLSSAEKRTSSELRVSAPIEDTSKPVSFFGLFRFSTHFEPILNAIGLVAAIAAGAAQVCLEFPSPASDEPVKGDPVRFVIKRGHATLTTIGRLSGFKSHQRRYGLRWGLWGPYRQFRSRIHGPLTGGTGPTDSSDITYGTPMYWLWGDVIKPQFPELGIRETFSHRIFLYDRSQLSHPPHSLSSATRSRFLAFCHVFVGLMAQTGALIVKRLFSLGLGEPSRNLFA
ncbi:hypothetical protein H4582DRAFT_2078415 [Lactarius indigo]|nr:hypothetical protein H4582DRAFT_2078415 [Lactarius indigo]